MNFRLKTSSKTADTLKSLQSTTKLTPNVLSRLAVSLSLKINEEPDTEVEDSSGIEFNRNTLTGEYDYVYKALITQYSQREISDEEFFPKLFNAHLERGITILENEYKHAGNAEKFYHNLMKI
ncbi:DNA sulfur modification protein DndE [Halobacillus faecis]